MSTALLHSASTQGLAVVPPSLSAATVAYQADQEPVRQLPINELIPVVGDLLNGAALLMGHKNALAEFDDLELMAQGIAVMIQRRFGSFKPAELSEAFQRGASGEYRTPGDILTVAMPTVASWLEAYQTKARAAVVAAAQQPASQLALPGPRIDYVGSLQDLVALAKAKQLPTGFDLDLGNVLYTWLKESGALTGFRTADQYSQMRAEETDRLLARTVPTTGTERLEYRTFTAALEAEGKLPDAHPLSRSVVNACKKRVLREWLHYVARWELDLADYLADPVHNCLCYRAADGEACPDCHDSGRKQLPDAA